MDVPIHQQQPGEITDQRRRQVARGADLCRRQPALWSEIVRYADQLRRDGLEADQAQEAAWAYYVGDAV